MRAVPEQLAAWQQSAAEATAKGSNSFYFATRFFPPHLAQAAGDEPVREAGAMTDDPKSGSCLIMIGR